MTRSIIRVAAGAMLAAASAAASEAPAAAEGIANYRRLSGSLAVAGAPSVEAAARLKDWGFRTVIDLRTEGEGTAEEKAAVEKQGLRYVSIPMTPATFSLGDARTVAKVLDDPDAGPVLLHCGSSNRVGGVYAVVQALKGKTLAEAEAAGREAGLKSEAMVEAMRRVAAEAGAR
jgi:uncharacterized protein (TIGR01244 family)